MMMRMAIRDMLIEKEIDLMYTNTALYTVRMSSLFNLY